MSDTDEEAEESYVIERLLSEKVDGGRKLYLVKWENYPDEQCTWEPVEQFDSQESIEVWEKQKAAGDVLPPEILADLERRMAAYQERMAQQAEVDYQSESGTNDESSANSDVPLEPPVKEQKQTDAPKSIRPKARPTDLPSKKGIARPIPAAGSSKSGFGRMVPSRIVQKALPRLGRPSVFIKKRKHSDSGRVGKRFRNLSHQNNYRKKARFEPEPNLPPERLKAATSLDTGQQTAHILPLTRDLNSGPKVVSPLFIPETSGYSQIQDHSPISEDMSFPPARVDHAKNVTTTDSDSLREKTSAATTSTTEDGMNTSRSAETDGSGKGVSSLTPTVISDSRETPQTAGAHAPTNSAPTKASVATADHTKNTQTAATDPIKSAMPGSASARQPTLNQAAESTERRPQNGLPNVFPVAVPPSGKLFTASNGREWYPGDIMCNFAWTKPIGDATIIGIQHYPFGIKIKNLKRHGQYTHLSFTSEAFSVENFHNTFRNSHVETLTKGLVSPFKDTQESFDELAEYLEKNDVAVVYEDPDPAFDITLLLYSIFTKSWWSLGWVPARSGKPRLHIAVVPKLVRYFTSRQPSLNTQPPLVSPLPSSNTDTRNRPIQTVSPVVTQKPIVLPQRQARVRSPSLPREATMSDGRYVKSPSSPGSPMRWSETENTTPLMMTPKSPISEVTTYDPRLRRKKSLAENAASIHSQYPDRLDYGLLTTSYPQHVARTTKVRLEPKDAKFFISFSQSHEIEAKAVQKWLETKTKPSNVYLDSQRHDWTRFKDQATEGIAVILFHADDLNFPKLAGLYQILFHEVPTAFSIKFGNDGKVTSDLSAARVRQLFPRATLYLITDSMIIENSAETLAVLNYFDHSKKQGYKIMMRPNVEQWLLENLPDAKDEPKRGNLIDILVQIRGLRPSSDATSTFDDQEDHSSNSNAKVDSHNVSYIIMPSEIPGYEEAASAALMSPSASKNTPEDIRRRQDEIFQEYFHCYAASKATETRRFVAFFARKDAARHETAIKQKIKDNRLDCGHVFYWELEKFVRKYCGRFVRGGSTPAEIKSPEVQMSGV